MGDRVIRGKQDLLLLRVERRLVAEVAATNVIPGLKCREFRGDKLPFGGKPVEWSVLAQ